MADANTSPLLSMYFGTTKFEDRKLHMQKLDHENLYKLTSLLFCYVNGDADIRRDFISSLNKLLLDNYMPQQYYVDTHYVERTFNKALDDSQQDFNTLAEYKAILCVSANHDSNILDIGHSTCKAFDVFFIIMKILRRRKYDTYVSCYQDFWHKI